jgi:hypothetical protein
MKFGKMFNSMKNNFENFQNALYRILTSLINMIKNEILCNYKWKICKTLQISGWEKHHKNNV